MGWRLLDSSVEGTKFEGLKKRDTLQVSWDVTSFVS